MQEFGRQAKKFGVNVESLESYQQLWSCVAPADQTDSISL